MPKDVAVVQKRGLGLYYDETGGRIGLVLHDRNLGNVNLGPEKLIVFPNGRKSWIPEKFLDVLSSKYQNDDIEDLLLDHGLDYSEDGETLVRVAHPDDDPHGVKAGAGPADEWEDDDSETQTITADDVGTISAEDLAGDPDPEKVPPESDNPNDPDNEGFGETDDRPDGQEGSEPDQN